MGVSFLIRNVRSLVLPLGLLSGVVLIGLLSRVGHHADRTYLAFSAGLFGCTFLIGWFGRRVPFALALLSVTGARSVALLRGAESHNLLFPLQLGLAAGLFAAHLSRRRGALPPTRRNPDALLAAAVLSLGVLLITATACAFVRSYSTNVLLGAMPVDREVAPGVSANYALYLTLLVVLNVYGPLLVAWAWHATPPATAGHASLTTKEIWIGLGAGGAVNLLVMGLQFAGVGFLFIGTGRSQEAARLPGLFTDSGMSSILVPLFLFAMYAAVTISTRRHMSSANVKRLLAAVLVGAGLLSAAVQGRALFLSAIGLGIFLWFLALPRERLKLGLSVGALGLTVAAFASTLFYFGVHLPPSLESLKNTAYQAAVRVSAGNLTAAFSALDDPRARLTQAGWQIFINHAWLGAGPGSFMVETARLRMGDPALPTDNPANLPLGLISDLGTFGSVCVLLVSICIWNRRPDRSDRARAWERYLYALPVILLPSCLVGYHIVAAEFGALVLLPLLLGARQTQSDAERRKRRLLGASTALATALYCALALVQAVW